MYQEQYVLIGEGSGERGRGGGGRRGEGERERRTEGQRGEEREEKKPVQQHVHGIIWVMGTWAFTLKLLTSQQV